MKSANVRLVSFADFRVHMLAGPPAKPAKPHFCQVGRLSKHFKPTSQFRQILDVFVSSLASLGCLFIRERVHKHLGVLWLMTSFAHQYDFYQGH